jgi:hypothetical protein
MPRGLKSTNGTAITLADLFYRMCKAQKFGVFLFSATGVWAQGFTLPTQALYHCTMPLAPKVFGFFCLLVFLCGTGFWNQGLTPARQTLLTLEPCPQHSKSSLSAWSWTSKCSTATESLGLGHPHLAAESNWNIFQRYDLVPQFPPV